MTFISRSYRRQRSRLLVLILVSTMTWASGLALGYLIGTDFGARHCSR